MFVPRGIVITTLATEAWLLVLILLAGASAAVGWMF
jgi:hypothetical protein